MGILTTESSWEDYLGMLQRDSLRILLNATGKSSSVRSTIESPSLLVLHTFE